MNPNIMPRRLSCKTDHLMLESPCHELRDTTCTKHVGKPSVCRGEDTVVAEMITELICFEPETVSVMEINWDSRDNLYQ